VSEWGYGSNVGGDHVGYNIGDGFAILMLVIMMKLMEFLAM
jgi:hypothetical protein